MNNNDHKGKATTLDEIVREISQFKKQSDDDLGLQTLIVESETGEILEEIPFLKFLKKIRFFEINRRKVVFSVNGPELSVSYLNSTKPFILRIDYDAQISERGIFNLVRKIYKATTPTAAINDHLKEAGASFIFKHEDFVNEYSKHEPELIKCLTEAALKCGLTIRVKVSNNITGTETTVPFIRCDHKVITKTKDAQVVEIQHDLALTLKDHMKFKLSGIADIKAWARNRLEQFTNNAVIEMRYAEVLVDMQESVIRQPMQQACLQIGYELKQLITVPGLEIEKFYFETIDENTTSLTEYITKDPRLKISINITVEGRMDLHDNNTKKYIKPGIDIIAGMKKNVVEFARGYINTITPDECFTQQFSFEDNLLILLRKKLNQTYGFKELSVVIKFLENNLSRRLSLLQEKPKQVELSAEWEERKYIFWFRVQGVATNGWYRFRANNYKTTTEELDEIARMVKNGLEAPIMRTREEISGKVIAAEFAKVCFRVRQEFGLDISIHDFNEALSEEEVLLIAARRNENEQWLTREEIAEKSNTNQLAGYLKQKEEAISDEESEEVIKKIDERIAAIRGKSSISREKFLTRKTDNNFLIPGEQPPSESDEQG